jgi:signal recognition particle subunit SRP14
MLLENDNFLSELTKLFQQQRVKNSGSLSLTMKRYDGRIKPKAKLTKKQRLEQKKSSTTTTASSHLTNTPTTHESVEYKCLVRAVYGSKKLSTIVSTKDINRFQLAYSNLLKANMDTLKKKVKETKTTGQPSANPNSNVPSSPTTTASSSISNQPKKTPTTPAKKK